MARIVGLGGGFAGLGVARALTRSRRRSDDAASVDAGGLTLKSGQRFEAATIAWCAGKFIVEELCFPDGVTNGLKRLFVAVPVKLRGCGSAWTRAMLWEA